MEAWHLLQELAYNPTPFALHAILELHIPEILSNSGRSLTSAQIAHHLEPKSPGAAHKLERMLRLLAHKGFFTATQGADGDPVRFGLTTVSRFFTTQSAYDLSAFARLYRLEQVRASWTHLRATVEGEVGAFEAANGTSFWRCASDNAAFGNPFHTAMATAAKVKTAVVARCYGGFRDAKKLVDVGGGVGVALREIVALHPHIVATNFDLPHVVAAAPPIPGETPVYRFHCNFSSPWRSLRIRLPSLVWYLFQSMTPLKSTHENTQPTTNSYVHSVKFHENVMKRNLCSSVSNSLDTCV